MYLCAMPSLARHIKDTTKQANLAQQVLRPTGVKPRHVHGTTKATILVYEIRDKHDMAIIMPVRMRHPGRERS